MNDIIDRIEIEALRAEITDAVLMRDVDRVAAQFTIDGVMRWPHIGRESVGRAEIRAGVDRYHRHRRKYAQRVYEVRYVDASPFAGTAPARPTGASS
ncbi:hypothetical protein ACQEVB_17560 [Pseudonocardia sp. CA-107938]|uniref:hypothetical protein n=1 Tax=Pseudonocardia sp. CA-107938 TaxID=3240021 RepID=UPI003D9314AE